MSVQTNCGLCHWNGVNILTFDMGLCEEPFAPAHDYPEPFRLRMADLERGSLWFLLYELLEVGQKSSETEGGIDLIGR